MKQTVVQKITENYKQMDYIHFGAWLEENIQPLLDEEKEQLCKMYVQGRNDNHLDYYPEKHAKETYDEMFKKD